MSRPARRILGPLDAAPPAPRPRLVLADGREVVPLGVLDGLEVDPPLALGWRLHAEFRMYRGDPRGIRPLLGRGVGLVALAPDEWLRFRPEGR